MMTMTNYLYVIILMNYSLNFKYILCHYQIFDRILQQGGMVREEAEGAMRGVAGVEERGASQT